MTVLVTGGRGVLGRELRKLIPDALAPGRDELDIADRSGVFGYFKKNRLDTVIHCAAKTSVRHCDENRADALRTNVEGTRNLCSALFSGHGGYFVYVSTACVFRGDEPEHFYSEEDIPYPKNFYGLSKLLGEYVVTEAVQHWSTSGAKSLVVRTNFVERAKWKYPSAFADRFGTYLYADQVAEAIRGLHDKRREGLVHICGDRRMSMFELARLTDPDVRPMSLKDYDGPPVTVNMCLTTKRAAPVRFG